MTVEKPTRPLRDRHVVFEIRKRLTTELAIARQGRAIREYSGVDRVAVRDT